MVGSLIIFNYIDDYCINSNKNNVCQIIFFIYCGEFSPKCNMGRGHVITQLSFSFLKKWISLVCDENCEGKVVI